MPATSPPTFPFLTSYDPPGASEGTLDPLGLYQIADQLAVKLVPAVRERMQRIRFLTAMAVGALVTEDLDDDRSFRDASPYLVWEWLVVEAIIRKMSDDPSVRGVPGTVVTRRALNQYDYLDARSYLKTPRIFGFHGVYKRLAIHFGVIDVNLGPGPNAERLVEAWAHGQGLDGLTGAKPLLSRWSAAVRLSLGAKPPRTKTGWNSEAWARLAAAFAPGDIGKSEKKFLCDLLHVADNPHVPYDGSLGALPIILKLQAEFGGDDYPEEELHVRLAEREPGYRSLLDAIRTYESFARSLQDAFDNLRATAAGLDAQGFPVPNIAQDAGFRASVEGLHRQFEAAHRALGDIPDANLMLQSLFGERFKLFAEPMDAGTCALALCAHHDEVQKAKAAGGKRPWFDRLGQDRIYIRHAYRVPRRENLPGVYVHPYRGRPIRRFYDDLRFDLR